MTIRYLIIESDDLYSSDYDYVDYLLDIDYKNSPSTLIDIPINEKQIGEIAYFDALTNSSHGLLAEERNKPIGKLVF